MKKLSQMLRSLYEQPKLNDPSDVPDDILLYVPNLLRLVGLVFFAVTLLASIPYLLEYQHDVKLVLIRLAMIAYSVVSLTLTFIYVGKYYKVCVLYQSLVGISFIFGTGAYMSGFNVNPHILLVAIYVLTAAFTIGRQGVVVTTGWIVVNYLGVQALATGEQWPFPTTLTGDFVSHENSSALFFLLLVTVPLLLGYSALIRNSLQRLKDLYARQRQHDRQLAVQLNRERARIGRDLHDGPLQDTTLMQQAVDLATYRITHGEVQAAQAQLQHLSALVQAQAAAIRAVTNQLRPLELTAHGLAAALHLLPVRWAGQVTVRIHNHLTARLHPDLEGVVYHVIREAVTNGAQHAQAQYVDVTLTRQGMTLRGEVRDDGQGFAVAAATQHAMQTGHQGLSSLAERLDWVGGTFHITSTPGQGTQLTFTVPLSSADIEPSPAALIAPHDNPTILQQREALP